MNNNHLPKNRNLSVVPSIFLGRVQYGVDIQGNHVFLLRDFNGSPLFLHHPVADMHGNHKFPGIVKGSFTDPYEIVSVVDIFTGSDCFACVKHTVVHNGERLGVFTAGRELEHLTRFYPDADSESDVLHNWESCKRDLSFIYPNVGN